MITTECSWLSLLMRATDKGGRYGKCVAGGKRNAYEVTDKAAEKAVVQVLKHNQSINQ